MEARPPRSGQLDVRSPRSGRFIHLVSISFDFQLREREREREKHKSYEKLACLCINLFLQRVHEKVYPTLQSVRHNHTTAAME